MCQMSKSEYISFAAIYLQAPTVNKNPKILSALHIVRMRDKNLYLIGFS